MALLTAKSVSKSAAPLRCAVSAPPDKTSLPHSDEWQVGYAYSDIYSIPARKHIIVADVERFGNPNKVGEVKARDFVLVQRVIKKVVQFSL